MSEKKLTKDLERLREAAKQVARTDENARRRLDEIVSDLEKRLDEPEDETLHHNLLADVREAIGQFEAEHPRTTAILNDIMVTLSNMGI